MRKWWKIIFQCCVRYRFGRGTCTGTVYGYAGAGVDCGVIFLLLFLCGYCGSFCVANGASYTWLHSVCVQTYFCRSRIFSSATAEDLGTRAIQFLYNFWFRQWLFNSEDQWHLCVYRHFKMGNRIVNLLLTLFLVGPNFPWVFYIPFFFKFSLIFLQVHIYIYICIMYMMIRTDFSFCHFWERNAEYMRNQFNTEYLSFVCVLY